MSTFPAASGYRQRSYRRHVLGMVGTFGAIMLMFTFVNTWINPLWVTPAPWTDESFAPNRQIYRNLRTAKAGMVRSNTWDVAMLGSSRVAIALDPDLPQWSNLNVVNLGLSGGSITENSAMARYVLEHQPEIQKIILGVDLTDLTSQTDLSRNAGFYDSPLSDQGNAFERELRYITGFSSMEASYKTIRARLNEETPPYTTKGHWAHNRTGDPMRTILKRDSIPFALRYIRARKAHLAISERKVEALRNVIRACLDRSVELIIFIPPNHAAYLSVFPLDGDPDPFFMIDRRKIVEIVAEENARHPSAPPVIVWDFNDYHPLNGEKIPNSGDGRAKYWVDGTHALETLGKVMLSRIHGWPLEDPVETSYGEPITRQSIERRERRVAESFNGYKKAHPEDLAWIRSIMGEYQTTSAGMTTTE